MGVSESTSSILEMCVKCVDIKTYNDCVQPKTVSPRKKSFHDHPHFMTLQCAALKAKKLITAVQLLHTNPKHRSMSRSKSIISALLHHLMLLVLYFLTAMYEQ